MARYQSLKPEEAEAAINKVAGLEPLMFDGQLQAIIAGDLRIYPASNGKTLLVSQKEPEA